MSYIAILLTILLSGKRFYQFEILLPPHNLIPRVTHNTIEDSNQHIKYHVNEYDRDFIVFLSREDTNQDRGETRVYYSPDGGITVKVADISLNGKRINVKEVQSTNGYMLLISYQNSVLVFLDKTGKKDINTQSQEKSLFLVHPDIPNLILRISEHSDINAVKLLISNDFGKTYPKDIEKCSKFAWVSGKPFLNALCENTFYSIDCSTENILFRNNILKVESIECTDSLVFIVTLENNGKRDIILYDVILQQNAKLDFPNLLKILKIHMAKISNGYIYIVADAERLKSCLFISRVEEYKLIRSKCDLDITLISYNSCPAYISRTEGLIYINRYDYDCGAYVTYISRNNGNVWLKARFSDHILQKEKMMLSCIALTLPCNDLKPHGKSIRRFEIFEGTYKKDNKIYPAHFFTYDWGQTWSFIPDILFDLVSLNMGYAMAGINKETKLLQYTLDEGYTWYSANVVGKSEELLSEVSSDSTDKDFLITIAKRETSTTKNLIFSIIDFRNILERTCLVSDYHEVAIPHAHTRCFKGKEIFCFHKLNTSFCLHPDDDEKCHEKNSCLCTYEDFECVFGYVFEEDRCIKDSFHELEFEKDPCGEDQYHLDIYRGYRKIRDDQCSIQSDLNLMNSSDYCKNTYDTNSIFILNPENFTYIVISDNGNIFLKSIPMSIRINNLFNLSYRSDLNHQAGRLYYSIKRTIFSIVFRFQFEHKIFNNQQIYEESKDIDEIWYDSETNSIIYNDVSHQLFIVSLITNFKRVLIIDAFNLRFYEKRRAISYFTSNKKFCYYYLYKSSTCIDIEDSLEYGMYDEVFHKIFFHYKNGSLIVFSKSEHISIEGQPLNMNNIQKVTEIQNVEKFDFIGQYLYYVKDSKIFIRNLNSLHKISLVHKDTFVNIKEFKIHQYSMNYPYNQCMELPCSYACEYTTERKAQCICPPNSTLVENKCICNDGKNCLEQHCLGFWCGNGKCIRKKLTCNGYDNCGNGADEYHCIPIKEKIKNAIISLIKAFLIVGTIILVVWAIYYSIKAYRNFRYRRSTFSFIRDVEFDYKSMI